jgi:signal transduction histidine kinase
VWGSLALLACALAFGIARSISGPIRNLRQLIHAAAEGRFRLPLPPRGPAEVAHLAEEFNHMVAARREVEADLRHSLEERTRQQAELQAMTRRLVSLQENERRDIARELHDRVGQNLASLSINLARLRTKAAGAEDTALVADCEALVETTGLVIQDVLTELKPPMLANYGLLDAVRWHAREFSRRTGIAVDVEGAEPAQRLDPNAEMALFRIAQGALNNVAQHARAKRAWISLEHTARHLRFEIRDDGVGFDAERALAAGRWGLTAMRERAEAIDGALRIESSVGAGTRVIVELDVA